MQNKFQPAQVPWSKELYLWTELPATRT